MKFFKKKQKLKVLHLPASIRWVSDATAKAENDIGIFTKKMYITPVGVKDNEDPKSVFIIPGKYCGKRKSFAYIKYLVRVIHYFAHYTRLVLWADVVHWQYSTRIWNEGSKLENYDFFLLKLLKKPRIVQFHGSDLRDNDYWRTVVSWWPESYGEELLKTFQLRAKKTQKNFSEADFCFAVGYGMYPFVKEKNKNRTIIMERSIELRHYEAEREYGSSRCVKIVHAPSNPSVKGTKYVVAAIENLKKVFDFEFSLIENMPHEVVLDALESADIVIDQLVTGEYGLFAVEGMNAGAAVISNVTSLLRKAYPADLPIIQADPNTIEDVLRKLLINPEIRKDFSKRGRSYALSMHECHSALQGVLDAYMFAAKRQNNKRLQKKIKYFMNKLDDYLEGH